MEHGIICRKPDSLFSYFGWGSVARMDEHTLVAVCSGQRTAHVCPWGKTELFYSYDDGKTWSEPVVVNDTVLDDRDAGIVHLGGKRLLMTWFNHPLRYCEPKELDTPYARMMKAYMDTVEPMDKALQGSYIRLSEDGGFSWGEPIKVEVSTPHGPSVMNDGTLLYLGKTKYSDKYDRDSKEYQRPDETIACWSSPDGKEWTELGIVPLPENTIWNNFHEPHAIQLPNGRILGMIRYQHRNSPSPYGRSFSMFQTWSDDGGKTWTVPEHVDVSGSPPHLLRHSSGAVICVYGRREEPYGERALISYDDGKTWAKDEELSRGERADLGYPCSVELADGSILTVYYQAWENDPSTSFLYTRWSLDEV
ncbi:MAG: exo-alpha-sialidase [Ruminococcaceae bacterium]|nr:exo-alpha-sialidase [Oscillospiraceae bacterium]